MIEAQVELTASKFFEIVSEFARHNLGHFISYHFHDILSFGLLAPLNISLSECGPGQPEIRDLIDKS